MKILFLMGIFSIQTVFSQTTYQSTQILDTLENEFLRIVISNKGAEIQSMLSKKTNKEYIWQGNSEFWAERAPILFPFVGKLWDDAYYYKDKKYPMKFHGFARFKEFIKIKKTKNTLWYQLTDDADSYQMYPFHFELQIGYVLKNNKLSVKWKVKNKGKTDQFFQIGGHPGFNLPQDQGNDSIKGYIKTSTFSDSLYYIVKEKNKYFLENPIPTKLTFNADHTFALTQSFFQNDAVIFPNHQIEEITWMDVHQKPLFSMKMNTPVFTLWTTRKNAPFICFEPWWGIGDYQNFTEDISKKRFMNQLKPNRIFRDSYIIEIFE